MHGLINRSIQCFLRDTYGAAFWSAVARALTLPKLEAEIRELGLTPADKPIDPGPLLVLLGDWEKRPLRHGIRSLVRVIDVPTGHGRWGHS